jgi:platelet-activating factor acetylhydrolase IB subunit alpha
MDECYPITEKGNSSTLIYFYSMITNSLFEPGMKILDLENRNAALQEELSLAPSKRAASQSDWVPRAPAAHVLTGHRATVNRVSFHPQYSILASASEDATIKIWDWETGDHERTLKGHTRAVTDVDFDHKGNLLGKSRIIPCL